MTPRPTPPTYKAIDIDKFLLIIGIVMVHANVCVGLSPGQKSEVNRIGLLLMDLFVGSFGAVYVPCFFIISGFLYFLNVSEFTSNVYKQKSVRRIRTLLIPYLLWNIAGLALQLLKCTLLNYPSYGIVTDGHPDILRILEGFWNMTDGYPYAVAFWFIRNLIIFVILSPLAYSICSNRWIFFAFLLIICLGGVELYGMQYFIIGGYIALASRKMPDIPPLTALLCIFAWVTLSAYRLRFVHPPVSLNLLQALAGFFAILPAANRLVRCIRNRWFSLLVNATFFIYALHQFFFTLTRDFYVKVFGLETVWGVIAAFAASCTTLIVVPFGVWLLMRRYCPRLTGLLTGNR